MYPCCSCVCVVFVGCYGRGGVGFSRCSSPFDYQLVGVSMASKVGWGREGFLDAKKGKSPTIHTHASRTLHTGHISDEQCGRDGACDRAVRLLVPTRERIIQSS